MNKNLPIPSLAYKISNPLHENRLLTAHPEYHKLFPTIASISMADLPSSPALKTLSISVLSKLSTLIEAAGNLNVLAQQLVALGADHKKMGIKRSDFDVSYSL
jgi:hypothetical protein